MSSVTVAKVYTIVLVLVFELSCPLVLADIDRYQAFFLQCAVRYGQILITLEQLTT